MSMERVVIYRLGSMGDTVAALPCFHLIERSFPHAARFVLTNVPVSDKAAPLDAILRPGGFIHGAIPYEVGLRDPAGLARLASRLRRLGASTLIYMTANRGLVAARRDVAFFRLCGFRRIIGAPLSGDLQRNRVSSDGLVERESHRLGRTLASLGTIDFSDRTWWDLRLTEAERAVASAALVGVEGRPILAVHTGGKSLEKDWGMANWASLLGTLRRALPGYGLVFVGTADDSARAACLASAWADGHVLDLAGRLSPRESAAALAEANLFIGHDSGPLHLADAVNTPSVGLFGAYNPPRMWHPSGPRTVILHRTQGLSSIEPPEVVATAASLLAAQPGDPDANSARK